METPIQVVTRRVALVATLALGLGAAVPLFAAGLPKAGKTAPDNGPYGLPSLKRVTDACSLTQEQEQQLLRIYNEYKHREHEEMQQKSASASSGLQDCLNEIKQILTPEQQKKLDELMTESKGKKKKKT